MQHLEVGEHLGPADLEHPPKGGGFVDDAAEVVDHVVDPDGLGLGRDPPWNDHRRQVLDQLTGQLPRCSAGSNDDAGAQHRHWHPTFAEKVLDLASRAQVRGESVVLASEPAEIDDLACAGLRGCPSEGAGGVGVASLEIHAVQRVHEVDRHVDTEQGLGQGVSIVDVATDGIGFTGVVVGVPGHGAHVKSTFDQRGDKAAADEPSRARDENGGVGHGAVEPSSRFSVGRCQDRDPEARTFPRSAGAPCEHFMGRRSSQAPFSSRSSGRFWCAAVRARLPWKSGPADPATAAPGRSARQWG